MANLLEALSDGSYDLQHKRDTSGDFAKKLLQYRNLVVSEYLKYKIDLSKAISKIAKRESLNDDQIQRIVEEVNNQIYLIKYDGLKGSNERDVEFDIASVKKVKQHMKGEVVETESKDESTTEEKKSEKVAFEQTKMDGIEKVASENKGPGIFSGIITQSYGDLSVKMRHSREDFSLIKIAEHVKSTEKELEKMAKEVNNNIVELGDAFVQLEKLGSNVNEVMSAIVKAAGFDENQIELIKEASTERAKMYIERRNLPDGFEVNFGELNLEKKASEKFTLGKFSLNKTASVVCDATIPSMLLSTNKQVRDFDDLVKMASEFKNNSELLKEKNNAYTEMREKCANQGIGSDTLENAGFFQ